MNRYREAAVEAETAYLHEHNSRIYEAFRDCYDRFYPSEQYAIDTAVRDGESVLDIGCNTGGLFVALKERHSDLSLTGVDPDPRCMSIAAKDHSDARLIEDVFPTAQLDGEQFDAAFCLSLYTHFTDWKSKLARIAQVASTTVVDVALTDGATVADPDVSYTYYLGSGERVPNVIINTRQFINYCFTEHVGAAAVEIVGVTPTATTGMPGVSPSAMIRGVAIIRRDTTGRPFFAGQQADLNPAFVQSLKAPYRHPAATVSVDGHRMTVYPMDGSES